jgi:lactobin A/cerein 7B family class IIb bacteriocin
MQELTFEQVEDVNGGLAFVPIALGVLTAISAIDAAVDAYRGYRDGVQQAKLDANN